MKTLVAIPCMDYVPTQFMQALIGMRRVGDVTFSFTVSTLVHNARNALAKQAVDGGFDRIMWLDSDMVFDADLMEKLSADLDEGRRFVSGVYRKRKPPFSPVIFKDVGLYQENGTLTPKATIYEDFPKDEVFKIAACGFGAVMHDVALLTEIGKGYGAPFNMLPGFGEDISFCMRCEDMGVDMYADGRLTLGHVAQCVVTEELFQGMKNYDHSELG